MIQSPAIAPDFFRVGADAHGLDKFDLLPLKIPNTINCDRSRAMGDVDLPPFRNSVSITVARILKQARGYSLARRNSGYDVQSDRGARHFAGVLNDLRWRDLERVWAAYREASGSLDADVERRTRFYIAVVPLFRVLYGEAAEGPAERLTGLRQFAARAAAATRRGTSEAG